MEGCATRKLYDTSLEEYSPAAVLRRDSLVPGHRSGPSSPLVLPGSLRRRHSPGRSPVIEAVPNVSEGRRADVIDALRSAVSGVSGVLLLDSSADASHNRSVYTLAGTAAALHEAVMRLFHIAVARIDLRQHQGVHPRIGAVDVVPFIPLDGSTMEDCVDLARRVACSVADAYALPVFLYEEAATRPERRRLEWIRKGQFEGLADKMPQAAWRPDFGPSSPHVSAGASAIGARRPLIAFNVNLEGGSREIARSIAEEIRESSGGLPCVKALGLWLETQGVAQVSMNLTDFTRTPIARAFDAVVRAAHARDVQVRESELIGLIPEAALAGTTPERIGLGHFRRSQILEERIRALRA